ncbi:AraC family transcriptional regulator [Neptunomonas phycophila]|uniref:AraC family transcriptional regulator n=1 Tax=Neptunomonas phycophila TaxID=1572645 RepID=A0AAW7XI85_9GAMM|nr:MULTISPECIES: AraC family transcriptional regulator [Neptunomonas]MBT3147423.1 AraC family transcriptional regulator [Neptunomonas phycophila]MDN2660402.1 AraC family transcriptional regulator [Neptunomonas sp. CHC150]MDO6453974.1 AraC family transcriptional regulator [Neptunomonas phycophila]MDO6469499.1 AraC family transcriptional regulator [Neptunomonas phycophila]MDO6785164.1 AraC family transcriptional regulator [Neptunomonas phycophila]
MYDPIQDGIEKEARSLSYRQEEPPSELAEVVHSYWELKTEVPLADDFLLHAIPDACVNILFNQKDTEIAGVTALRTTYEVLNLGKDFHYAGIQFFPGAWQGDLKETSDSFVGTPYQGSLPLVAASEALAKVGFECKQSILSDLVLTLMERKLVAVNTVTQAILSNLADIKTVADMAAVTHMSTRQLQRSLKKATGFAPHDFLKVIRLQQSFKQHYLEAYTDQSHFIHSFRNITGYTPAEYYRKYVV